MEIEGLKKEEKRYKCELCHDTGWYGDSGPGIKGNSEYQRCECEAPTHMIYCPMCKGQGVVPKDAGRKLFEVDIVENLGDNWLIADFGKDEDGKNYILTTTDIHVSEFADVSSGAKGDAELVCRLLNRYHADRIKPD